MKEIYKDYLFEKHILVSDGNDSDHVAAHEDSKEDEFEVQTEEEAEEMINTIVKDLLLESRPLNDREYALALQYILDHDGEAPEIASKSTLARLLIDTKKLSFADEMNMSDVMKIMNEIKNYNYNNDNPPDVDFVVTPYGIELLDR